MSRGFQCRDISSPWLNVFIGIFILLYFILLFFDVIGHRIVSFISLSDSLLLVYKNTINFFYVDFVSCDFTRFVY